MVDQKPNHATLRLCAHPLIQHKVTRLRDECTDTVGFRTLVRELTTLLLYEATRDLTLESVRIRTPLEETDGYRLAARIGLAPIMRAGLGMVEPALALFPTAEVWHLGIYRDEATHTAVSYYNRLPPTCPDDLVIILDPMLATGGSAADAASLLKAWGAPRISFVGLIASPEGVALMAHHHPDVQIVVGALDRELDANKFIRPGLGDAGDRLYGTFEH